jgi:hypothetical protein
MPKIYIVTEYYRAMKRKGNLNPIKRKNAPSSTSLDREISGDIGEQIDLQRTIYND